VRKRAEKLKVPSLKLKYAVLERIYGSDNHPGTERLCSFDRVIATFEQKRDAEFIRDRHEGKSPNHVYEITETVNLKEARITGSKQGNGKPAARTVESSDATNRGTAD